VDFDGDSELRAKNGTLKLTGSILDVGVIGTADATGILNVTQPWNSNVTDKVELKGGQIIGATFSNTKHVTGFGTLGMAHLINIGSISAGGNATLTINTPSPTGADLDGVLETGQLVAINGNIRVFDSSVEPFNGTVQVGQGRTLRFENGWTNNGTTTLTGSPGTPAVLSAGAAQHLGGTLHVNGQGQFAGPTVLSSTSKLNIDLGGSTPGVNFDQMTATDTVALGGKLALAATGGYAPNYLVSHKIMSMPARSGVFATVDGVVLSPTKYLAVRYDPFSVFVTAALPGDANLNGAVTLEDFNQLAANFGVSAGATWVGGDFTGDGAVTLVDFNALAGNFGISAGASGPSIQDWATLQSAVPEPTGLLPLIGFGGLLLRQRRR
jgi:MYXO-CTERM domain-containing protein